MAIRINTKLLTVEFAPYRSQSGPIDDGLKCFTLAAELDMTTSRDFGSTLSVHHKTTTQHTRIVESRLVLNRLAIN